jgi:Fe2+ or Zn2+ uptake regulation protein
MPMSGKDFKKQHPDSQFCKLTIESECHGNFLFQTGVNVDDIRFDSYGMRMPGKIIFIDITYIGTFFNKYGHYPCEYIEYSNDVFALLPYNKYKWIRSVNIDDDAIIYGQDGLYRATKLTLSEREDIWSNDELCKIIVTNCSWTLEFVHCQTDEIRKLAVKQNGWALKYVNEQTDEICLSAVKQNGLALEFVDNQTDKICLSAVKQNGLALEFVDNQTAEICLAAVKQNGSALEFVNNQTDEMCEISVRQSGYNLAYVNKQTYLICKIAVQNSPHASQFVSLYYKFMFLFDM